VRYPWVNRFEWYVLFALFTALIGIWIVVRLATRWRLRSDAFPFFVRFFILMVGGLFGAVLVNPELGLYAAWPLFWISLAILLRPAWIKGTMFLVAAYLPLRIIFIEMLTLLQREMSGAPFEGWLRDGVVDLGYVTLFMFLSLPFVFGLAALYRTTDKDFFLLRRFRSPKGLIVPIGGILALGVYLLSASVYDSSWQKFVRVEQRYVMGEDSSTVRITGSEGVEDVSLSGTGERDGAPLGMCLRKSLDPPHPLIGSDTETTAVRPDSARPDSLVRIDRV
jgi:hypothetical protein